VAAAIARELFQKGGGGFTGTPPMSTPYISPRDMKKAKKQDGGKTTTEGAASDSEDRQDQCVMSS
jgi:hypothetical protein